MLFNSPEFIVLFLPITLGFAYLLAAKMSRRAAVAWMVVASCFFYAWFSAKLLALLFLSIVFNFALGSMLSASRRRQQTPALTWLVIGIVANLSVLAYFKYANFFIENVNFAFNQQYVWHAVLLPIGISFFTFQKIGFLVDAYRGEAEDYDFLNFCLFVMYFPQLIAGPIVHHKDLIPQFKDPRAFRFSSSDFSAGMSLFALGLVKKVFVADGMAVMSDAVFTAANTGGGLGPMDAWTGALAFTFQIYFDFSGYSDMAIGLALMSGIRLPSNFNSPYQAESIVEFWRRWHMTLSRFMRDYIYVPLGGNRLGKARRFCNLMLTMLIGGLWHGAAWTFVAWGGLHGVFLILNHGWGAVSKKWGAQWLSGRLGRWGGRVLTFLVVVIAWVFFRAESFSAAWEVCLAMTGLRHPAAASAGVVDMPPFARLGLFLGLLLWVWCVPNASILLQRFRPVLEQLPKTRIPTLFQHVFHRLRLVDAAGEVTLGTTAGAIAGILVLSVLIYQSVRGVALQQFIYFQF